jgi:integrative and conjugative element protein (TIGR02256 family)
MLLGWIADQGDVVVRGIIGPGPHARHKRFRFIPDADYQQRILEEHFNATSGRETYLGDWHTHPDGQTELSQKDKRTLARIARTGSSRISRPIMLVLAGQPRCWTMIGVRYRSVARRFFIKRHELESLELKFY